MTAETEIVIGGDPHAAGTCFVGRIVQIAFRIGRLVIDGGGNDPGADGLHAEDAFQGTGGAEGMADCAFGAADRNPPDRIAQRPFQGNSFVFVQLSAGNRWTVSTGGTCAP